MSKIILVTGASSDVGTNLIESIVGNYDKVIAHYRNSAETVEKMQLQFGDKIVPLQADFADEAATVDFADKVSRIDVSHFVHIPAMPNVNKRFTKTNWSDFETHIAVEVRSAYMICKAIIPTMARQNYGKIIFMLTENVALNMPGKFAVPYTASKYELLGLLKCLAAEYAEKNIMVNGVSPSMIDTRFISQLPELARELNAEQSPLKRNLTPADVIGTFAWLLSDGANAVTGQNISVSAGR